MEIYAQFVPESARRGMEKTREMFERRIATMQQLVTQAEPAVPDQRKLPFARND
jgi:hypothetical protein